MTKLNKDNINQRILQLLKSKQSLTFDEIMQQLEIVITTQSIKQVIKWIAELEEKQQISFTTEGKIQMVQTFEKIVEGKYRYNEKGFGFVTVTDSLEDIYIPKQYIATALDGDSVQVELFQTTKQGDDKKLEGKIIAVIARAEKRIVGQFVKYHAKLQEETGYKGYVIPQHKLFNQLTCFVTGGLDVVDGTICVVDITTYPTEDHPKSLEGILIKEIGFKDTPGVDILSVLLQKQIPTEFPEAVLQESEAIPLTLSKKDMSRRLDLRQEQIVTIDGDDAKDLDDAISLKVLSNGHFELGVHIADVSHYVTENSALDIEAYNRATSVYLADRVVPMLPQRLSNGICSLHPFEDRLTLSCLMEIDMSGEVVNYTIKKSIIHSKKRMTYNKVNAVLTEGNKNAIKEYEQFISMLELMRELHYALYHKRRRRGAIDFETNESKIVVDEMGHPVDIIQRERGLAERMIESFMLVANETVAKHFMDKHYPFIYRVHEEPAVEKMQKFMEIVTNFGVLMKGKAINVKTKDLQKVLTHIEDKPYEKVVSTILLRSMKQAKYDSEPLGHFGLATEFYTHFTSPIRRYPDLIVHRFIKKYSKKPLKRDYEQLTSHLHDVAQHSSIMERKSVEAEREVEAMKKAEFMLDKIGQQFEGVISSVTRFGIFVELDNTIEGLVHISKIDDDHYEFIENQLMLLGQRTGKIYQLGQKVKIIVTKADKETREIDFKLAEKQLTSALRPHPSNKKIKKKKRNAKKQVMQKFVKNKKKNRR